MPDYEDALSPDMTGANGASGAMDEDGAYAPEEPSPEEHSLEEPSPEEPDNSPVIQSLNVSFSISTTHIVSGTHTSTGMSTRRISVPGHVTAKRLGDLLQGIATW